MHFSPPVETRTWFHLGPVGDGKGDWTEAEFPDEYWEGDANVLKRPRTVSDLLARMERYERREALRTLRGTALRSEAYSLDGTAQQWRPWSVSETLTGVARLLVIEDGGAIRTELSYDGGQGPGIVRELGVHRIFLPYGLGTRSSAWERGDEPMTNISLSGQHDQRGFPLRNAAVAVPRSRARTWRQADLAATEPYLATVGTSLVAHAEDGGRHLLGRPYQSKSFEASVPGTMPALDLAWALVDPAYGGVLTLQGWSRTWYDDAAHWDGSTPIIGFGELGAYGIPVMTESLVMDGDQLALAYGTVPDYLASATPTWPSEYPADFQSWVGGLPARLGHHVEAHGGVDHYFVRSRSLLDFMVAGASDPRGLALAQRDPFGNTSTIGYDAYRLMPVTAADALGNTVTAVIDYRLMQPRLVTDPNGNRAEAVFSPLGLVVASLALGKVGGSDGDTPAKPGSRMEYDLFAWMDRGEPAWVRSSVREHHALGPDGSDDSEIVSVAYSDGFGRILQTRAQAAALTFGNAAFGDAGLPAAQGAPNADAVGVLNTSATHPNVIVSGRQSYDNKGRVVESWEPYHDTGWDYAPATGLQTGQKAVQYYDAGGRAWRSLAPDGTETRVVFGTPAADSTPWDYAPTLWERWSYDANDLASLTHGTSGHNVPAHHWWTPRTEHIDALGRVTKTIDRNHDGTAAQAVEMQYTFDIRGNLLRVDDALKVAGASRPSAFLHSYDYANRPLKSVHIEKGASMAVFSAVGQPVEARDAKGALALSAHDALLRPTRAWARDKAAEAVTLRQVQVYGEDKPNPAATNHIGRGWKAYDGAGLVEVGEYDFKGNPLWKERRVIKDEEVLSVFDPPPPNWNVQSWVIDWTGLPARESILETAVHRTDMQYDALNRPVQVTLPADAVGTRSVLEPTYNRAGAVESLSLDGTAHIRHIAYNARGQRVLAAFGNGIMTRHTYDPVNFRLLRQRSEPYAHPPGQPQTYAFQGGVRQDTAYQYDLAGNITAMVDASPDAGVGGSGSLQRDFGYDALYRLLRATGRESGAYGTSPDPWDEDHVPDQGISATRAYTRTYEYDAIGNLLRLRHAATGITWNRWYNNPTATSGLAAYAGSNLLNNVTYGSTTIQSQYDACGNLVQEGAARFLEWDAADQLRSFRTQTPGSEPSEYAHYLYDAGGDRVKKVVRKQGGMAVVSVYLGGVEHHYELTAGVRDEEYSETHVMDGRSRVAVLKAFGATWSGSVDDALRYNLEDHLGNACFLLGGSGGLVSREEYFPFGETSFCFFGKQRYRFCGKERDEESGLYYYGARYYAAWCCRFVSIDPLAAEYPFYTPYQYAGNQPVISVDIDGLEGNNQNNNQGSKPQSGDPVRIDGPTDVIRDKANAAITGTIFVHFDSDALLGENPQDRMNQIAQEIQDNINGTIGLNQYQGKQITSNISVIPVPNNMLAPEGAHVFEYGRGANDPEMIKNGMRISHADKGGISGYLYNTADAAHEFMHWMGLSDRYTELALISNANTTGGGDVSIAPRRITIPLANVQPKREGLEYVPGDNLMARPNGAFELTAFQLDIVFNGRTEEDYSRDVVLVHEAELVRNPSIGAAIEFKGHRSSWYTLENLPLPQNSNTPKPSTVSTRLFSSIYFGRRFGKVSQSVNWQRNLIDSSNRSTTIRRNRSLLKQKMYRSR